MGRERLHYTLHLHKAKMELPSEFPIFPLDEVLLVPGQMLPLHIFEPRYRQMVEDALAGDRMIAMAMSQNGSGPGFGAEPSVRPVCGLGRIVHHQEMDDGRSDIILEGVARMEIEQELDTEKLYRVVRASKFCEISPKDDVTDRLRGLLGRIHGFTEEEREVYAQLPMSPLLDSLLLRIPAPPRRKHEVFGAPRLVERLALLEKIMDDLESPPSAICFEPDDPRLN